MKKYENMYLADIQINNKAPMDIVAMQIEAKKKGLEAKRLYEVEQAKRVSITIAEYDELREKIKFLSARVENLRNIFKKMGLELIGDEALENCKRTDYYSPFDDSAHIFLDFTIERHRL